MAKQWHQDHNTFHFLMGEIIVTPKDVYRIFQILTIGDLVYYDQINDGVAFQDLFKNDSIDDDNVSQFQILQYDALPAMLVGLIGGFLLPDHRGRWCPVGWGQPIQEMIDEPQRFAWGSYILVHLYHDLHQVVYLRALSLSIGVILLQIWTQEHLPITHLVCV